MVWLYWSYSVWISSRLHELFYCVVQFYNDEEHWTVVLSNSGASVNRSASIPVRRVQQGVHTALLVGVALSQGSRSRIPVRAQATPRQSLRVWGVWSHDWASRATLRSPQTSTSVQSGAASSPRQALLQVHWTINVRRRVAVPTTLARPAVSVSTAGEYLIYCSLDRPVVIIRVRFCRTAVPYMHSILPVRPVHASWPFIVPHRIICSWYTGCWWVGFYIWYSEEGTGRGRSQPRLFLAVPNVKAHPSTASVPTAILLL